MIIFKRKVIISVLVMINTIIVLGYSQEQRKIKFTAAEELRIIGKIAPTAEPFHRVDTNSFPELPAAVKKRVVQSGGLAVSFKTNSSAIYAKWCTVGETTSATMTAVAFRGLDLYIKKDDKWQYAGIARPRENKKCTATTILRGMDNEEKECLLYLPLYDETSSLEIGVDIDASITAGVSPFNKRVLIYGSSIVQGSSASRSGMAYPARLSRETGVDFLNLGMGGSAKMEKEVADMVASFKADAFLLDCVPNASPKQIQDRAAYLIKAIREKHAEIPIIVMQSLIRERGYFNIASGKKVKQQNEFIKEEVEKIKNEGMKNIHFISSEGFLGYDHEGSVDGTHPNDLGFDRMIQIIKPRIMEILFMQ